MGTANFKQYDSRWGKKNYNGSSTMAQAGCGPTAVADIVHNVDPNINPWKVAKWMKEHGYAIRNNGTAWAGIPAALKHFGLVSVLEVGHMADVFSFIKRGYKAVFLMKAGKRGGVVWTTSGHFICVSAYKHEDGKHWFWTRDPGGRGNNGWHSYEGTMKNLIAKVWVCKVPEKKAIPVATKVSAPSLKPKAKKLNDRAIADAYKYNTKRSKYRYPDGSPKKQYKADLNKAYPHRERWWKQTRAGAACDVFVPVVIRATGIDKKIPHGLEYMFPHLKKSKIFKLVKSKKSSKGRYFSPSMLRGGDFVVLKYKGGGGHTFFVVEVNGKKYIAEANYHGKAYPHISKPLKKMYKKNYKLLRVYRVKE